jgi:hypothetical protein
MTVLAFLTERAAVKKILEHLGLPATGPPKAPARGAAQLELDDRPAALEGAPRASRLRSVQRREGSVELAEQSSSGQRSHLSVLGLHTAKPYSATRRSEIRRLSDECPFSRVVLRWPAPLRRSSSPRKTRRAEPLVDPLRDLSLQPYSRDELRRIRDVGSRLSSDANKLLQQSGR